MELKIETGTQSDDQRKWQLAVDTTGTVAEIHLARTMKALRNV